MQNNPNGQKVHLLKCVPHYFEKVCSGEMSFQLRKNDRDFKVNDVLLLNEFVGNFHDEDQFTGRMLVCKVNCILGHAEGMQRDYVLLNITKLNLHVDQDGKKYVTRY